MREMMEFDDVHSKKTKKPFTLKFFGPEDAGITFFWGSLRDQTIRIGHPGEKFGQTEGAVSSLFDELSNSPL